MRLVVQRVSSASVTVVGESKVVGKIGYGLFVLVGVREGDKIKAVDELADKLSKLRIMKDKAGKMNLSVKDVNGQVLAVSQFTLYADTSGGNRPSFIRAANPKLAEEIYERFIKSLRDAGVKVETGKFGEYMQVTVKLDGPVTITLEA